MKSHFVPETCVTGCLHPPFDPRADTAGRFDGRERFGAALGNDFRDCSGDYIVGIAVVTLPEPRSGTNPSGVHVAVTTFRCVGGLLWQ